MNPDDPYGKLEPEHRTVLGLAANAFYGGAVIGGIAGGIAGIGVAAKRLLSADQPSNDSPATQS